MESPAPDYGNEERRRRITLRSILRGIVAVVSSLAIVVFGLIVVLALVGMVFNYAGWLPNTTPKQGVHARTETTVLPAWDEFMYVMENDEYLRDKCDDWYEGNLDVCYERFGSTFVDTGAYTPEQWWPLQYEVLTSPPTTTTVASPPTTRLVTRSYQSNQYGCHDDGRCLDDYDHWCDEADLVYFESTNETICPASWDLAEDYYIDLGPDPYYDPEPFLLDD